MNPNLIRSFSRATIAACFFASATVARAQDAGDEAKEMFNHAKQRDQKAIDEAKNGWWKESMKTHNQRIQWWRDAKFGMFVHWGISAVAGGEWKGKVVTGYAEHLMRKEKISRVEYLALAKQFNPVNFNADQWIRAAKQAGAGYFIVTAKHHDGLAMYDSKFSDFDLAQTPFKRDPMAELAAAAKKHGIRFGFYYSHAFDWEHPDAPGNDWEFNNPGGDKNIGGANWFDNHPEWLPKAVKYVDEKAIPQIKELITKYKPDILWFDTPHKLPLSENIRILKAIREADPNIVVNGRLARGAGDNFGDYANTADRPAEFKSPSPETWEAIPTTNESYGYSLHDKSHKPAAFFVQLLAKAASRGGNILVNVGPRGDGSLDPRDAQIYDSIGLWVNKNRPTIFKTTKTPLAIPAWGVTTQSGNKLYLHVFNWPKDGKLLVGGLKSQVNRAYLYTDAKKSLPVNRIGAADQIVNVPLKAPDAANSVVVLDIKGKIEADSVRRIDPAIANRFLVFDGNAQGKFGFGDGKTNRYHAEGWKSKSQFLFWDLYSVKPATYKVLIKYLADDKTGGAFTLQLDDVKLKGETQAGKDKSPVITQDLGVVTLKAGKNYMAIKADEIKKDELIKLLEIQLIPVVK
jgi:alpha-L-fucosidase